MIIPASVSSTTWPVCHHTEFRSEVSISSDTAGWSPAAANSPMHQAVALKIAAILLRHAETTRAGYVFHSPCNVLLSRNVVVQPDILFVRHGRQGIIGKKHLFGTPDLVVEMIPRNGKTKYLSKKSIYARFGIQELWTVDPERGIIETWTWSEAGYIQTGSCSKSGRIGSPVLPRLRFAASEVFS